MNNKNNNTMKKVILTMCAAVAVIACTKTEATFEQPGEIAFSPVSQFNTKAAVTDNTVGGQNFYVFANTMADVKYFANVVFVKDGTPATGEVQVYKGNPTQYWPNATNLKFAGYTVSGNVGASKQAVMSSTTGANDNGWGKMTITDYVQPLPSSTDTTNTDLMWFFDSGVDGDDSDTNPDGYGRNTTHVTPTMKHALSWITINVDVATQLNGDDSYWADIKLHSIKMESLYTTGDVALTASAATWTSVDTPLTNVVIYQYADSDSNSTNDGQSLTGGKFTTTENTANNTVVIPQTPVTLAVEYSYKTKAGGTVKETITGIALDYDGVDTTNEAWQSGVHYTYNLTIGVKEIKIAPSSEPWTPYGYDKDTKPNGTPITGTI